MQENISSDLLLYLKGWFSFVVVFRAPYLSSLLSLQPNKLAIVYKNWEFLDLIHFIFNRFKPYL